MATLCSLGKHTTLSQNTSDQNGKMRVKRLVGICSLAMYCLLPDAAVKLMIVVIMIAVICSPAFDVLYLVLAANLRSKTFYGKSFPPMFSQFKIYSSPRISENKNCPRS